MDISQMPNKTNMNKLWIPERFQTNDPYTKTLRFNTWEDFDLEYGDTNEFSTSSNQVIDFYFENKKIEDIKWQETTYLNLMMFHPRQSVVRGVIIRLITNANLHKVHDYLFEHKVLSDLNFDWVVDRNKKW